MPFQLTLIYVLRHRDCDSLTSLSYEMMVSLVESESIFLYI